MKGHLELLKWLHSQGCILEERECDAAAMRGHLDVVQWLHSQDCKWLSRTCRLAAEGGHLEVLKYLWSHGCEWNWRKCQAVATNAEVLQWIQSQEDIEEGILTKAMDLFRDRSDDCAGGDY